MNDQAATLRRVRALFDEVMDHPAAERRDVLRRLAADHPPEVVSQVEELITTDSLTGDLPGFSRVHGNGDDPHAAIGERLGAYEVVRHVGLGGMGVVYEAVRADDQYRKRVAIKLVHRGLDSQATLARFRRERQILANLEHPNIATLLDGGVASDGRPFLVMEYVNGIPITQWCRTMRSTTEQRLALFIQVCEAVQHAHRNLVVHLDLKPGNILVTEDGKVKLLDFGIARLLEGEDEAMPLTRGARALTPEYASPEHTRGEPLTTASDVYSLGVILFEMLTDKRPQSGTARLGGDLGAITMMALRAEPERRYLSVEAMRNDVARHLARRPVLARPYGMFYTLDKFIRRNVVGVALSFAVVMALAGGIGATMLQARIAEAEHGKAEELSNFLRSLLSTVRPTANGNDVPVTELLESAAKRIDSDRLRPSVRAELEGVIGQSYQSLGRFDEAIKHFARSQSLWESRAGASSVPVVGAMSMVGGAYLARGDLDSAERTFARALAMRRSLDADPDTLLAGILENLGEVARRRGNDLQAARLTAEAMTVRRRIAAATPR